MKRYARPAGCLAAGLAACLLVLVPWKAAQGYLTVEERRALDLGEYTVTDRNGSYFDVAARMKLLRDTDDPLLVQQRDKIQMGLSCREMKAQPVIAGELSLPSFYDNPNAWQVAAEPLLGFEERMSRLAGAWVATRDPYYANCIVDILETWAKANALYDFKFSTTRPQAWYAVESMIFSAALSLSTVTGQIEIAPDRRKEIESWLSRLARNHFRIEGPKPSCCNNHYYRRTLYMTVVGVVTDDDRMFRDGIRAVYSAIDDIDERGAFGLAMRRGWRAIHYQNYSLIYLITTMQVAFQQGYDLFKLEIGGKKIQDAVHFLMRSLADPYRVEGLPSGEQDLTFTNDGQYLSWVEIWLAHHHYPAMERFARLYRPLFNRGAGGYITLYFKAPESPIAVKERQMANVETERMSASEVGARYPYLARWRRAK